MRFIGRRLFLQGLTYRLQGMVQLVLDGSWSMAFQNRLGPHSSMKPDSYLWGYLISDPRSDWLPWRFFCPHSFLQENKCTYGISMLSGYARVCLISPFHHCNHSINFRETLFEQLVYIVRWKCVTVQIFEDDSNKSKSDSGGN
jgi:hypothetical protein